MEGDSTDICEYIRVKKILHKDRSLTKVVRGTVLRKNVAHKKMNTELKKARVLMISGDVDVKYESVLADASSINKEKEVIDTMVKKILRVEPNIIITSGSVHR